MRAQSRCAFRARDVGFVKLRIGNRPRFEVGLLLCLDFCHFVPDKRRFDP